MKTAMQELMDALNDLEAVYIQNDWRREVIGINQAKNLIEYIYLEKEKEQIVEFSKVVLKEYKRIRPEEISTIKRLYNETFNTNKQ
jgi:hypothetical protein